MPNKAVRFGPYYLEDPDDERIPMSMASYYSRSSAGSLATTLTSRALDVYGA